MHELKLQLNFTYCTYENVKKHEKIMMSFTVRKSPSLCTVRLKINSHSQMFRHGRSIFFLPHRSKLSDFFGLCIHWVSIIRDVFSLCTN